MSYSFGKTYLYPHEVASIGRIGLVYVAASGAHEFVDMSKTRHETHCPTCARPSRRQGYLIRYQKGPQCVSLCKFGCDGPVINPETAEREPDPAPTWPSRTKILGDYHLMEPLTVEVDDYGAVPYYVGTNKPLFDTSAERAPTREELEEKMEAEMLRHNAHIRDYHFHQAFA